MILKTKFDYIKFMWINKNILLKLCNKYIIFIKKIAVIDLNLSPREKENRIFKNWIIEDLSVD